MKDGVKFIAYLGRISFCIMARDTVCVSCLSHAHVCLVPGKNVIERKYTTGRVSFYHNMKKTKERYSFFFEVHTCFVPGENIT